MEMLSYVNWLGVVLAGLAAMIIGGLWYSPLLFARAWVKALGKTPEEMGKPGPAIMNALVMNLLSAFLLALVFQWLHILVIQDGLVAALNADTFSLTAWQIGMYGFMAVAQFYFFRHLLGLRLEVNTPEFWFMMQIAMLAGFITSYPVNWWLIKAGIKERM